MQGTVIGFDPDSNTGAIGGDDGRRYDFGAADWRGESRPRHGERVDFVGEGDRAAQVTRVEAPGQEARADFVKFFLTTGGRISRSQYWLWYFLPVFVVTVALNALSGVAAIFEALYWLFALLTLWPGIAVMVKRIHDRDKPGWLVLLPLAAGVLVVIAGIAGVGSGSEVMAGVFAGIALLALIGIGLWFFVEFGCMRGTVGPNRYGPDPIAQT
jgi:uncharacterized membrane protein YhaH (DUF805 family)